MNIESKMDLLYNDAIKNKELREALLSASKKDDPMLMFCKVCQQYGHNIYLGELFAYGQDMSDSKLRSVNGGGVSPIEGWDDAFDLFINTLEY